MKRLVGIFAGGVLMLNIGCAKENKSSDPSLTAPLVADCSRGQCTGTGGGGLPVPPGGTGGTGGTYSGSSVPLDVCGGVYDNGPTDCTNSRKVNTLKGMFFNLPPNNPTNIQINIDMTRTSDTVVISYNDGGKIVEAGLGTEFPGGSRTDNRYNGWVTQTIGMSAPSPVYKGFFQDQYGAIVVVIDKLLSDGDGQPAKVLAGSVWYQNFMDGRPGESKCQSGTSDAWGNCRYGSYLMCWEITYGPYDCRTFITPGGTGGTVTMTSSLYPNNRGETRTKPYVKLGDFAGLSRVNSGL